MSLTLLSPVSHELQLQRCFEQLTFGDFEGLLATNAQSILFFTRHGQAEYAVLKDVVPIWLGFPVNLNLTRQLSL